MTDQTKEAWTPGPWEATNRLDAIGNPMKGGRYVILQKGSSKREDFFICEMPFAAVRAQSAREHDANARLIAAADDLYWALREARDFVFEELKDYLECACVMDINTWEANRDTMDDADRAYVEVLEAKLARIDAALSKARGE